MLSASREKFRSIAQFFEQAIPWHKLPLPLGLLRLIQLRRVLRAENLHDTRDAASDAILRQQLGKEASNGQLTQPASVQTERTPDGTWNDLDDPIMGAAGTRFGRNVPVDRTHPERGDRLLSPNPRIISQQLLARTTFVPATSLNLLAASWIQFMTTDWFSHGQNEAEDPIDVPLPAGDPWPVCPMKVPRTRRDPTSNAASRGAPTYANTVTHWWDGSQIYGSDAKTLHQLRAQGGKLAIRPDGRLPIDERFGFDQTGFESGTMWIGRSMLHTLFAREHNAICDRLRDEYRSWSDDEILAKARLIVAAVIAKIHTVEWTPALLSHPTVATSLRVNWFGLETERLQRAFGRLSGMDDEIFAGIPGSETDHHSAPYSLTEEFVAVYRMHSLVPDWFVFRSSNDDRILCETDLRGTLDRPGRSLLEALSFEDLFYSFGRMHPGALRLHNFPRFLQNLDAGDGTTIDLATVDILRGRERGVPRYNEFRRLLHMAPARRWSDVTSNATWQKELARVYGDDVEALDMLVGSLAEDLPEGFAFSDTQFRIFILMASRRLKSDRFFTSDFTPLVYSQVGMDWIRDTDMTTLLLRHYPDLGPSLRGVSNAFAPWRSVELHQAVPIQVSNGAARSTVTNGSNGSTTSLQSSATAPKGY
ncbi:peroxidase family protein [Sorangium sp. So ce1182]|uniref:peroxidase family protein n=1 Tax=Sorangium sp. So ce1182 TaxID=3133334 RepID=UPI003F63305D